MIVVHTTLSYIMLVHKLFSQAMEMVSSRKNDHLHISFMTAEHTKWASDRIFFHNNGTWETPMVSQQNLRMRRKTTLVSQFYTERVRPTCDNTAAANYHDKHRPKVALDPSMADYCDTCKHVKELSSWNEATGKCLQCQCTCRWPERTSDHQITSTP